jgi:cystathionine beta-lyase
MDALDPSATMYGTYGTPTTRALADLVLEREGGKGVVFAPSGLAAVSVALLSVVEAGKHLLVPDSCYGPTREFCDTVLARLGVVTEYYDPTAGGAISSLMREHTCAVFMESPGSYTFEIQDVPAIVRAARASDRKITTLIDNAWGSPGLFHPFAHDVDISVVPLTKYWGGHADLLVGAVVASDTSWPIVRGTAFALGVCSNADEAWLALRGARSVETRLPVHERAGLEVARWLKGQARVGRVLHPAMSDCAGHDLWRRDFKGSNGLFSFELLTERRAATASEVGQFVDALAGLQHFSIGYSWGGYESLVMPAFLPTMPNITRTVRPMEHRNLVRLHIGLEPVGVLIGDLERALAATQG